MRIQLHDYYFDGWCPPDWCWGDGNIPFSDYDLWCVRAGEGDMRIDNGAHIPLRRGICILFAPGMRVKARHNPDAPLHVWAQHFDLTKNGKQIVLPGTVTEARDMRFYESLFERISSLRHETDVITQTSISVLLEAILHSLAAEPDGCTRQDYAPYQRNGLEEAAKYLRNNPAARPDNTQLAAIAGMHPNYFCRAFQRLFGSPPGRYAIRMRCDYARHLLRESDMPIKQIAAAAGYPDTPSFSKQFRKETGITALDYRTAGHPSPTGI